jgi:hypothetical protein
MTRFKARYENEKGEEKLALIECLDTSICRRILIEKHGQVRILEIKEI